MLHVLRHLDGKLADSLIGEYPQLAAAAARYPNGMESIQEEAKKRRRDSPRTGGGFAIGGSRRGFGFAMALMGGSRGGDFEPAFQEALRQYREDTEPGNANQAPREFWPSTNAFRTVLYKAGVTSGRGAEADLERIPHDDLRLFAQIELAAALAGLPELRGSNLTYRPRPERN